MTGAQVTLARATGWILGESLDRNQAARVRMLPAEPGSGIRFRRVDLPGGPEILVCIDSLRSMPRWTSFEAGGTWIHHTEHVLAAVAIAGIDNLVIETDGDRIPMVDGGRARPFHTALVDAGRIAQERPRLRYVLQAAYFYADAFDTQGAMHRSTSLRGGRYVMCMPAPSWQVTYVFDWAHLPRLPVGAAEYEEGDEDPLDARSYLVGVEMQDVESMLGDVRHRVMRLDPGCDPTLSREAARHKIVDFIGDMMAAGRPIRGRFAAVRTGHRIHHAFLKHLIESGALSLQEDA